MSSGRQGRDKVPLRPLREVATMVLSPRVLWLHQTPGCALESNLARSSRLGREMNLPNRMSGKVASQYQELLPVAREVMLEN